LTDFHNSFTDTFSRKRAIKLIIKIPPHLKCVATLLCEMLMFANRATFCQSLMVSVGVSKLGCTHSIFVDPGVNINGWYYREVLLSQHLIPATWQVSGDFFVLQQHSAPAHTARKTIKLLQQETPAFLSPDLWPPNSPDLNPVDYKIWCVMQDRVYQKKSEGRDVNEYRERLVKVWAGLQQNVDQ